MTESIDQTAPPAVVPAASDVSQQTAGERTGSIKRTSGPQTTNGSRWEVQLSAVPSREWLEFFKTAGGPSLPAASPQRVLFDRASASFTSDEDHVEQWIESIDRWIAAAQARYAMSLDEASRERSVRFEAEAKNRERIRQLNDRFKNL
jgi:hypothetical protein